MNMSSKNSDLHHTLPHNLDAETGLIGSMLLDAAGVCPMVERLAHDAWYQPAHLTVANILLTAARDGTPMDIITLTAALRAAGQLEAVGGAGAVSHFMTFTPTAANAGYYLGIVKDMAKLRRIHLTAAAVAQAALDQHAPPDALSEQLQQLLTSLAREASTGSHVATMAELVPDAITRLEERHAGKGKLRGIPSGLGLLDRLTGGWQGGQMIVIGAREKEGKSSLARQFVLEAAVVRNVPTAIFSHEMSREEITDALIATRARVDSRRIEDGLISETDFANITRAAEVLAQAPIFIFDEADSSVLQFRANARRAVQEHGCGLIVLDYLQLIGGGGGRRERSREEDVSEVGRNVKLAAKELNIPIIVLSQLNADGYTQYARAIQQHLDKFIVIEHENPEAEGDGKAWIRLKLSRGGPKGSVLTMWRPAITRFDALAPEN